ncbi:tumor necrosis factor receptor superfamily member 5-like isoform X1 [Sinocyclocheilus anshuiensis]|uniref:Tumor necrosis factor receptor superfamily member 5-like n=2 Tax=Sinocyclocheilus anshuiensis TaxID=1608454 RepID=A0A671LDI1_9TELE|nr:PREDICTED: tumor necrosis factor receptor superfamily member 5-like isoform X1 [Sinocyclocheilus anshuiensis]XP_016315276.1 PREDICTED: tumor necrosis factor receptor superfamily member 5-like isoform X1 [Sinocyclocheilus anshuiensis]XP_016322323.1 PREDICTED: tumor necrosis factor receptor superfamily member 5-like isoform X1 [Sinocyclocheilus anshuiensis]XP_016322324.1 PREDICTED: tumor necrosis factor receptor superfamily member 5-like isoform X1 [Sinocyclocheilus anshuiensis]
MISLGIMLFIAATLNFKQCFSACARAEYEIHGECCPMCAPGNHVYWHCTVDTSTTCIPCPASTYIDEPNGLDKCFPCSVCDAGLGLRIKKTCTRSADTICEPLEGFYCTERKKYSCRFAVKHSECYPGQYVKQTGTAFTDTVCGNCMEGTYSNGSFTACRPHSNCEIKGLKEIKPGTISSDVECGKSVPIAIIVGVVVGVIVGVLVTAVGIKIYCKVKQKRQAFDRSILFCSVPIPESDGQCEPTSPDSVTPLIFNTISPLHQSAACSVSRGDMQCVT